MTDTMALPRLEIAFIFDNLPDWQLLAAAAREAGREVVVLDGAQDGLAQMADYLHGREGVDAIHIVSHGAAGVLQLGTAMVTTASLQTDQSQWHAIGQSLSANGDLLLYGCDVAAGAKGQAFVQALSDLTGADVAASTDLTGNEGLGGNWVMESQTGAVDASTDWAQYSQFSSVLAFQTIDLGGAVTSGSLSSGSFIINGLGYTVTSDSGFTVTQENGGVRFKETAAAGNFSITITDPGANPQFTAKSLFVMNDSSGGDPTYGASGYIYVYDNAVNKFSVSLPQYLYTYNAVAYLTDTLDASGVTYIGTRVVIEDYEMSGLNTLSNFFIKYVEADLSTTNDTTPPTVSSVTSSAANGIYKAGDVIAIRVAFSEAVTVTGTPQLTLETGSTDRVINYTSGSGSSVLTFNYTVQAGDISADLDYVSTAALAFNGGSIRDAAGNSATLTLPAPGAANSLSGNTNIAIDGAPPQSTSTAVPVNATYTQGQHLDFSVTFGETVMVNSAGGTPSLALTLDTGGTVQAVYLSGSGTDTLTFRYTVAAGNQDANGIAAANSISLNGATVKDAAGNNAVLTGLGFASTSGVLVDAMAPEVQSIVLDGPVTPGSAATAVNYTVTFSENVTGVDASDFTLTATGTAAGTISGISGSGSSYTVTVNGLAGDGTLRLDLNSSGTGISDMQGNAVVRGYTSGQAYILDHTAPQAPTVPQLDPGSDTGNSSSDRITSDTTPTLKGMAETGSTVTLYDTDGLTVVGTAVAVGGNWSITSSVLSEGAHTLTAKAVDQAGNVSAHSSGLDITIDTTAPALAITSNMASLKAGESATITFVFSEEPVGFDLSDVVITNGTLSGMAGQGLIRVATFTPNDHISGGEAHISVPANSYVDAAGNLGQAATPLALTLHTQIPTTSNVSIAFSADSGVSGTDLITSVAAQTISGMLDAPLASGETVQISLDNGSTWKNAAVSGKSWSLENQILTGSNTMQVRVMDEFGNIGPLATANYVIDTRAPEAGIASVVFSTDSGSSGTDLITNVAAQTISGVLDAPLAGGEVVELSLDNGATWTTATASGTAWSVAGQTLTGSNTLQVRVVDLAGNTGPVFSAGYVLDTTPPAATFSNLAFSGSGSLVVNTSAQTLTATLNAALDAGDTLWGSLDNGNTWTDITGQVNGTLLNWTGISLIASDTLQLKVVDAAGNGGMVSSHAYELDTTAPAIVSVDVPADATYTLGQALDFTVHFGEAITVDTTGGTPRLAVTLDTGGTVYANYLAGSGTDALQFRLIVASGQVDQTGITVGSILQANGATLRDAAGNDADLALNGVAATSGVNINAPALQPPTPTSPGVIDGAAVTMTKGDGGTVITTIAVIAPGRADDPGTPHPNLADIPLIKAADGHPVLEVSLPVGVGLQVEGLPHAIHGADALAELGYRIERVDGANAEITSSGQVFYASLNPAESLTIQTITASVGPGYDPGVPFVISGSTAESDGKQAVILDARGLPAGAVVQVDNVDFIAVVGNVRLIGGAGQNMAAGDDASQWIVLGADDDILHGGGGNDIVGSLGGNDQAFGDAGDDVVFGGTGNDTLSGGAGNDHMDGGLGWDIALQGGSLQDYNLSRQGDALVLTHKGSGEVDSFKSVEMIRFDNGASLYVAASDAEAALAHIATRWLHRDLTPEEGVQAQLNSQLSALEIAQAVLRGPYGEQLQEHSAEELIAGWQDNPQILRMDVTPETVQGGAGLDTISYGLQLADVHLQRVADGVWEGTDLRNGSMAELHSIERLHFSDASVALDTDGAAGTVAALIAVTLGGAALHDKAIATEGLALIDSGWNAASIGAAALQLAMGPGSHSAQDTVQWLWSQAHGSAGTAGQLQPYVQLLQSGAVTAGDLAWEAAQYALAHPRVELAGVLEQGLVYAA